MSLFNAVNLTNAFISVAPRSVGGSFRVVDAFDPALRARGISPEPKAVIKRELVSVSLVWIFTLLSSGLVNGLQKRLKWPRGLVTLVTALAGNIIAEGLARVVAYRQMDNPPPDKGSLTPPLIRHPGSQPVNQALKWRQGAAPVREMPAWGAIGAHPASPMAFHGQNQFAMSAMGIPQTQRRFPQN